MSPERQFLFVLAPHLGMTVSRLERELPYRELLEWMDEYRRNPWGSWRDNAHAGMIAATVANVFRGDKGRPLTFEDFMIMDPETAEKRKRERQASNNAMLVQCLKAIAKPKE